MSQPVPRLEAKQGLGNESDAWRERLAFTPSGGGLSGSAAPLGEAAANLGEHLGIADRGELQHLAGDRFGFRELLQLGVRLRESREHVEVLFAREFHRATGVRQCLFRPVVDPQRLAQIEAALNVMGVERRASAHSGGDGRMGGEREGDSVCNIACRVGRVISECREAVL